jgi:uncharacterized membrane protein YbhN (UPF0104 family)
LVGLALQLASFAFFTLLFLLFLYRVKKNTPHIWNQDDGRPLFKRWKVLAAAMGVSCVGILVSNLVIKVLLYILTFHLKIRSFFRVIELGEGWGGHLATTEIYFYTLDTLPLFIAISVYIPFWPGRFIDDKENTLPGDAEESKSIDNTHQASRDLEQRSVVMTVPDLEKHQEEAPKK